MAVARADPTATLLDDGSVLIFGGCSCPTAELYEPATGVFVPTGPMNVIRTGGETATLLQDGLVLVTGGDDDSPASKALASAELYDPKAGTFRLTGSMTTARTYHTATLLPDGQVLVAGGFDSSGAALDTAELYDPATGEFVSTSHMGQAFDGHTATLLADGRVLVVGGTASCVQEKPLASAELYDPATGTFSPTGSMATARDGQSATRLGDGRVLIAGGDNNTAELYDPGAGTFSPTGSMKVARASQTATLLADGLVLLAGGADDVADGASAELYQP
jgi:WD40 repeat protein